MTPEISLIHPTARTRPSEAFPLGWLEAERSWFEAAEAPERVEYILAIHESRWGDWRQLPVAFSPWGYGTRLVCSHGRDCCVDNSAAAIALSAGKLLVIVMDDLFPPQGWDRMLVEALGGDLDQEAVVHVSTGARNDDRVFIPQVCTRKRLVRYGYVGHPAYYSMFVDNEFTDVARRDGVVIEAMHIRFHHRHPHISPGAQSDGIYESHANRRVFLEGKALYEARKAAGFPKEWPPCP